ncbi:oxygenase MpaB family protein [Nocardia sp. NPDC052112]|uniref:oxygenase MpaB family protein n=1 Tax=Nocardia sp. NPDC052112 TaxID=3155646 RepID=UPI003424D9EA
MYATDTADRDLPGAPLGPGSLTWKYLGDRRMLLFLGRTGTLQNMHPAVGAALQDHSNFFDDPWDRLLRSVPQILGMIYDADPDAMAARVRDYHKPLKGTDPHGRRYHALNPDVFWWTHVTFIEVCIAINEFFGTPLTGAQKDQLVAEGITWWRMYGLSDRVLVADYVEFKRYWDTTVDTVLESNATTDYAFALRHNKIPAPPGVPDAAWALAWRPVMGFNVWLGAALMPPRCREILNLSWTRRDQKMFTLFATTVRGVWPLLPTRARYLPRAHVGVRRTRRGGSVGAVHASDAGVGRAS